MLRRGFMVYMNRIGAATSVADSYCSLNATEVASPRETSGTENDGNNYATKVASPVGGA